MSSWDFQPQRGQQQDMSMPRFYIRAVKNQFKSDDAGHEVFEDREYVEIITPGNNKSIVDRQVRDEDKQRWPGQYAAFKANQEPPLEGWPLKEWGAISASLSQELASLNIKTVEQLANLADQHLIKIMGGYQLREKARLAVEQAAGQEPIMRLHAENEALKKKLEAQAVQFQGQLDELKQQFSERANA
jgi:hypothetical protein